MLKVSRYLKGKNLTERRGYGKEVKIGWRVVWEWKLISRKGRHELFSNHASVSKSLLHEQLRSIHANTTP
jgi:hypothetical protein